MTRDAEASVSLRVPAGSARAEVRVRGSLFLGLAGLCLRLDDALLLRAEARRRHYDATHHVLAARPLMGEDRFDDDGEPAGTAGRPVLAAIDGAGVSGVSIVVVRWFGGTKLGTGGLARAYARAATSVLERLPLRSILPGTRLHVRHAWSDTGAVARVLEAHGARRMSERHGEEAEIEVIVRRDRGSRLSLDLAEVTSGRARVEELAGDVWLEAEP